MKIKAWFLLGVGAVLSFLWALLESSKHQVTKLKNKVAGKEREIDKYEIEANASNEVIHHLERERKIKNEEDKNLSDIVSDINTHE